MTNLLHYSPIDVWMFNAAPICNVCKYGDITTTRESVTCPDCNRILDALDVPAPVVDMFAELPKIGDVYEFDYVYNERGKTTERLIVVDVTDEHVMYKMPGVSVNKIFPMTHEVWIENTDERRKVDDQESLPLCSIAHECYFGQDGRCLRGGECYTTEDDCVGGSTMSKE